MTRALIGLALWWGLLMAEGVGGAAALAAPAPQARPVPPREDLQPGIVGTQPGQRVQRHRAVVGQAGAEPGRKAGLGIEQPLHCSRVVARIEV